MTGNNGKLWNAKRVKNDEFYTQLPDIEKELRSYVDYDPNVFRGKTILLPCDDPEWSNFTRFFVTHFDELGVHKLVSTCYDPHDDERQPSIFDVMDADRTPPPQGKIFTMDRGNATTIDPDNLPWRYLPCDGDFRSEEITALRDEADMVITNPPFSLFREFVAWLAAGSMTFAVIGSTNVITYKEIFPLIQHNKLWLGGNRKHQ